MCGRGTIADKEYERPEIGDLVYVLEGIRHETGIIVSIEGSIYHKHIEDWFYYILMDNGDIKKKRGWRVEKVKFLED